MTASTLHTIGHRARAAALACAVVTILAADGARADDVLVSWSSVAGAAGYVVYVRESGQFYGAGVDVGAAEAGPGSTRHYRVSGVRPERTTYFAVAAYNSSGAMSALSNELSLGTTTGGGSGGLVLKKVRLVRDGARNRDSGRLRLRGGLDESDTSGMLEQTAAAGGLGLSLHDGGAFAVTFDLSACRQAGAQIHCASSDDRAKARFRASRRKPSTYRITIEAHDLSPAETGFAQPAAPVSVTLHHGATLDRSTVMANCKGPGERVLICKQP